MYHNIPDMLTSSLLKTSHREKNWSTLSVSVSTKSIPEVSGSWAGAPKTYTDIGARTNTTADRDNMLLTHHHQLMVRPLLQPILRKYAARKESFLLPPPPDGIQVVGLDCVQRCHAADAGIPFLWWQTIDSPRPDNVKGGAKVFL